MPRKIIQFQVKGRATHALCADGTLWAHWDGEWHQAPDIPDGDVTDTAPSVAWHGMVDFDLWIVSASGSIVRAASFRDCTEAAKRGDTLVGAHGMREAAAIYRDRNDFRGRVIWKQLVMPDGSLVYLVRKAAS